MEAGVFKNRIQKFMAWKLEFDFIIWSLNFIVLQGDQNIVKKLVLLSSRPIVLSSENITDSAVRRLIYDAGENIDDLLTLCEADITTKNEYLQKKYLNNFKIVREKIKIVDERDQIRNFQPPVTGQEIMNYFDIRPCKEIGIIKDFIKESILNGDILNTHREAKELMIKKGKTLGLKLNE